MFKKIMCIFALVSFFQFCNDESKDTSIADAQVETSAANDAQIEEDIVDSTIGDVQVDSVDSSTDTLVVEDASTESL